MNFKDMLIPFAIALLGTWIIQTLFFSKTGHQDGSMRSGQSFTAPLIQAAKPLNTEVDFVDTPVKGSSVVTHVETEGAVMAFNSAGAVLEELAFKRKGESDIVMVLPDAKTQCEKAVFLVALEQKTPYFYKLIQENETDQTHELVYEASFYAGILQKKFIIYKDRYQIDLLLSVNTHAQQSVEPRIFYPSPCMQDTIQYDVVSAIVNTESGSISKISRSSLDTQKGWFAPTLFGTESKYFIQAVVADPDRFIQRAYFKNCGQDQLTSILEGPVVTTPASWNMTFYFGPKERKAVEAVDDRLEQIFEYSGLLAPLSRLLLALLVFLYSYVHNYGVAIIILTVLFKLLLLPLTYKSEQGMKKQVDLRKKLLHLQQKYKNDPQVLARERNELIRKHGVPATGFLVLLLQLPIFFALNRILSSSIQLYQAPFLWIKDLAATDPYYILPLLVCVSMLISALTGDPNQRMTMLAVALVIGAVVANLAAGLALFIIVSTGLGFLQTAVLKKVKQA